jgi:hypothetical protein
MVTAVQRQLLCGALADCRKSDSSIGFETQKRFRNLARITIFKIAVLLIGLGSSMMQHILIVITKIKRNDLLLRLDTVAKALSTHISNDLTHVNVPAEDGSQ